MLSFIVPHFFVSVSTLRVVLNQNNSAYVYTCLANRAGSDFNIEKCFYTVLQENDKDSYFYLMAAGWKIHLIEKLFTFSEEFLSLVINAKKMKESSRQTQQTPIHGRFRVEF